MVQFDVSSPLKVAHNLTSLTGYFFMVVCFKWFSFEELTLEPIAEHAKLIPYVTYRRKVLILHSIYHSPAAHGGWPLPMGWVY